MSHERLIPSVAARNIAKTLVAVESAKHFYRDGLEDALEEAVFGLTIERAVSEAKAVLWRYRLGAMSDPCDDWSGFRA